MTSPKSFFKSLFFKIFPIRTQPGHRTLPKGWTETKISEILYITHVPEEQKQKWTDERRKKHHIQNLAKKNGFYLISDGRIGFVYYVEDGKICELDYEISGAPEYDFLFNYDRLNEWFFPEQVTMSEETKNNIKVKFVDWLSNKRIKALID